MNASIPRELERLIARCHRKDPARRLQSMADLRSALEELRDDLEAGRLSGAVTVPALPVRTRRGGTWLAVGGAVLLVGIGTVIGRTLLAPAAPKQPLWAFQRITADVGVTVDPAVTATGDLLAYASDRADGTNLDIWVQPTAGGDPVRVTTDPADDSAPSFSPDRSRIAFRSEREGGGIYVVSSLGGTDRLLVAGGDVPRYSPDGKWLLYRTGGRGSPSMLYLMAAAGGTPQRIARDRWQVGRGVWSDDSRHILFVGTSPDRQGGDFVVAVSDQSIAGEPVAVTGIVPFYGCSGSSTQTGHSGLVDAGTRRTIVSTAENPARLDAARGRLVFSVQDLESNIWSLTPK